MAKNMKYFVVLTDGYMKTNGKRDAVELFEMMDNSLHVVRCKNEELIYSSETEIIISK